jgi:hypothetical protein
MMIPGADNAVAVHHNNRVEHRFQDRRNDRRNRHMSLKSLLFAPTNDCVAAVTDAPASDKLSMP